MREPFNPEAEPIKVAVDISGPNGTFSFDFAIDTAATTSLISKEVLRQLGYVSTIKDRLKVVVTGGNSVVLAEVVLSKIVAFGEESTDFPILCLKSRVVGFEGLLGLDLLRGRRLIIDFREGYVELE